MSLLDDDIITEDTLIRCEFEFNKDGYWLYENLGMRCHIKYEDNKFRLYSFYVPKKGLDLKILNNTDLVFTMNNISDLCHHYYNDYIRNRLKHPNKPSPYVTDF